MTLGSGNPGRLGCGAVAAPTPGSPNAAATSVTSAINADPRTVAGLLSRTAAYGIPILRRGGHPLQRGVPERQALRADAVEPHRDDRARPVPVHLQDAAGAEHFVSHRISDGHDRNGALRVRPIVGGGPGRALAGDGVLGDLREEARRQPRPRGAVDGALLRVRQEQTGPGARHPNIAEAALLLHPRGILERAGVGKQALFQARQHDDRELEALRAVEAHENDAIGAVVRRVLIGEEREVLEEHLQRRIARALLDLAGDRPELIEVFQPRVRFVRALGLEQTPVAAHRDRAIEYIARGMIHGAGRDLFDDAHKLLDGPPGRRAAPGVPGAAERVPQGHTLRPGPRLQPPHRRVADAAPRHVQDATQAGLVRGIVRRAQVREDVLDLRPLVEAQAADDPVRYAQAEEHLLELTRLRVRAVEHGHLAGAAPRRDVALDLLPGVPRLLVSVPGRERRHGVALAVRGPQDLLVPVRIVPDHAGRDEQDTLRGIFVF